MIAQWFGHYTGNPVKAFSTLGSSPGGDGSQVSKCSIIIIQAVSAGNDTNVCA